MSRWAQGLEVVALGACLIAAAVGAGCKGAGSGSQPAESGPMPAARVATESNVAAPEAPPPETGRAQPRPLEVAGDRRFQLALPAEATFIAEPLAPEEPRRVATFEERSRITVGKGYLQHLDLLPGERALLVSSGEEASVRVYERASKRALGNFAVVGAAPDAGVAALAWPELGPDGAALFVTATAQGLALFSAATGAQLAALAPQPSQVLRWSPDRRVLVAKASNLSRQTSVLHFYRRAGLTLEPAGTLEFEERVDGWDLSRDNRLLALSHYPSDALRVLDLHTGADVLRVAGPRYAGDVSLSPDGRWVAVGGAGILVVDLLNPDRRGFYSYLRNNVGSVRFSPGGGVLAASAYDGRVRLFQLAESDDPERRGLGVQLLRELSHAGQANVYALVFEADGAGLLSSSGDKTVRWFRANAELKAAQAGAREQAPFRTLDQWREHDPKGAAPWPPPREPMMVDGHYQPASLQGPPRATRLRPGRYSCKITSMYRLRDCSVTRDASGHTLLEFSPSNLLGLRGVVHDDGPVVRFEGWLTEPSTLLDCQGCEKQPIHGLLRGDGNRFRGVLTFRHYHDPHHPPQPPAPDVEFEEALDRYPIELNYVGPAGGKR